MLFDRKEPKEKSGSSGLGGLGSSEGIGSGEGKADGESGAGLPATVSDASLRLTRENDQGDLVGLIGAIRETAEMIEKSDFVLVLTGAGLSVESGIPDFRSPGGLWTWYEPSVYASLESFIDDPSKFWEMAQDLFQVIDGGQPNAAHFALAEMEKMGRCQVILSQNIDDLLERAGCSKVIKLHGNFLNTTCLDCGSHYRTAEIIYPVRGVGDPRCPSCGGHLKPDVVLFNEPLNPRDFLQAKEAALKCDLILVIGSSLEVYPVASLPEVARKSGADIAIFNVRPTALDKFATVVCRGKAAETVPALLEECKIQMGLQRGGRQ